MRLFFDHSVSGTTGTDFFATPSYMEVSKASIDPPGTAYLYVKAGPLPHSVTVAACWGDELDAWLPLLTDPERSADWIKALASTFPTIGRLWDVAAREDFGNTGLVREIDPDEMSYKWFAQRSIGNVPVPEDTTVESVRAFLSTPQMIATYRSVLNDSFTAVRELATHEPSLANKAHMYGKEFLRSQIKALDTTNEWAPRLSRIFGVG